MADMNITPARPGLTPTIWDRTFFNEYVRTNQFSRYYGTSEDSMIQLNTALGKEEGDSVVFAAVRRLVGAGVTGNTVLEGNEEVLNARSFKLTIGVIRHAVAVSNWDEQKSVIDLRDAARGALMTWAKEKMRNDIISSLGAITADNDVSLTYAAATAGQRNTYLTNNADRILFGAAIANGVSNVFATALATIDNTADKLTAAVLNLAKRRARTASPHIRPIKVNNDEEWFVVFVPSLPFRDLSADPVIVDAMKYAWQRGQDNPLFTGGDLLYNGMIIREIPELPVLRTTDTGGSTIDVGASYMCGAQALGIGWAQRTTTRTNVRDYGFMNGVAVQEMRGIGKLRWGVDATTDKTTPVDAGIVTIWTAAVADA